jgi:hypothetical protein
MQPVDADRVFQQRSTGELFVWRGKLITPATPEELEFIHAKFPTLNTVEPREDQEAVAIPNDWEALDGNAKRSLAASLSSKPIRNIKTAEAVIRAELRKREDA